MYPCCCLQTSSTLPPCCGLQLMRLLAKLRLLLQLKHMPVCTIQESVLALVRHLYLET